MKAVFQFNQPPPNHGLWSVRENLMSFFSDAIILP